MRLRPITGAVAAVLMLAAAFALPAPASAQSWWLEDLGPDGEFGPEVGAPLHHAEQIDAGVRDLEVPESGPGDFDVLPGQDPPPDPEAEIHTVSIEVERGLDVDLEAFGAFVMDTLNDERGWPGRDGVGFERVDSGAQMRVVLATGATVDEVCAPLQTGGYYSCATAGGEAMLNAQRWATGAEVFTDAGGSLTEYRQYLVNHEVGHLLGYLHEPCPGPGRAAPVMLQQSMKLDGCEPNGWLSQE